jgi:hypothetical protein
MRHPRALTSESDVICFAIVGGLIVSQLMTLPAFHNPGATDVLCTDNTGTLTEARIALTRDMVTRKGPAGGRVTAPPWQGPGLIELLRPHFALTSAMRFSIRSFVRLLAIAYLPDVLGVGEKGCSPGREHLRHVIKV